MIWANPEIDLRTLLSDGSEDKLRYRKRVFGEVNGNNTRFKTLEFRRVTDFTSAEDPLGVWIDGVYQTGGISSDSMSTGDFILGSAPSPRSVIEASYYVQWFNDTEIQTFLRASSNWLSLGDDYTRVVGGLQPAALKYAAADAYQKLSLRWAEHLSETFLLNDAPSEKMFAPVDQYSKMSLAFRKEAEAARDAYYTRAGQNLQPLFGAVLGNPSDPEPVR
jgi:hypothetical protein